MKYQNKQLIKEAQKRIAYAQVRTGNESLDQACAVVTRALNHTITPTYSSLVSQSQSNTSYMKKSMHKEELFNATQFTSGNIRFSRNGFISKAKTHIANIYDDVTQVVFINFQKDPKDKRIKDLECYIGLLEEKMKELKIENDRLKQVQNNESKKFEEASNAYEEMLGVYSKLSKDYIELKKKESDTFEKYVIACQEREKILVDTEAQSAHFKTKIKLLEEVLTKRNEECKEISMKYRKAVIYINVKRQTLMGDKDVNKNSEATAINIKTAIRLHTPSVKLSHQQIISSQNSSLKEMKYEEALDNEQSVMKVLDSINTELLFPTQLKSYYASCEF